MLTGLQIQHPSVAALYEDALVYESGSAITSSGALSAYSGAKMGRSPQDKRIVQEPSSQDEIWWGPVNKPMSPEVRPQSVHPVSPRPSPFRPVSRSPFHRVPRSLPLPSAPSRPTPPHPCLEPAVAG